MCCKPLKTMGNRNLKISSTIPIIIAQSLKMFKVWNLPTANSPFAFSISVWGSLLVVRPLCVMLNGNISKCDSQKVQSPRWFSAPISPDPIWCHLLKLSRCKSTSIASALAGQPSEHFAPKADSNNFPLSRTSSRPAAAAFGISPERWIFFVVLPEIYQQGLVFCKQKRWGFPSFPRQPVGVSSAKHQLKVTQMQKTHRRFMSEVSWGLAQGLAANYVNPMP